ncbi:hypothetical protein JB92DRAFT_2824632 [Gautieria morchelliformis]|nr:hypothetical protein JB92DRAFT_2824632 [Gautieria morchelliformis]
MIFPSSSVATSTPKHHRFPYLILRSQELGFYRRLWAAPVSERTCNRQSTTVDSGFSIMGPFVAKHSSSQIETDADLLCDDDMPLLSRSHVYRSGKVSVAHERSLTARGMPVASPPSSSSLKLENYTCAILWGVLSDINPPLPTLVRVPLPRQRLWVDPEGRYWLERDA